MFIVESNPKTKPSIQSDNSVQQHDNKENRNSSFSSLNEGVNVPKDQISDSQKVFELYNSIKKVENVSPPRAQSLEKVNLIKNKDETESQVNNELLNQLIFQDLNSTGTSNKPQESPQAIEKLDLSSDLVNKQEIKKPETNFKEMDFKQSNKNLVIEQTNLIKSLSNNSILSTITNDSQKLEPHGHQKILENEILPEWIKENCHVIVSTNSVMNKPGFIKYMGPTKFAHGTWIGVELEQPFGKNDGSYKGIRYFKCPENHGVFVRADKLSLR